MRKHPSGSETKRQRTNGTTPLKKLSNSRQRMERQKRKRLRLVSLFFSLSKRPPSTTIYSQKRRRATATTTKRKANGLMKTRVNLTEL